MQPGAGGEDGSTRRQVAPAEPGGGESTARDQGLGDLPLSLRASKGPDGVRLATVATAAGNRSATRWVGAEGARPPGRPLDAGQVEQARPHYTDASVWSPAVVRDLQRSLNRVLRDDAGLPGPDLRVTGVVDDATIQAVARLEALTAGSVHGPDADPSIARQPVDGRADANLLAKVLGRRDPFVAAMTTMFTEIGKAESSRLQQLYEDWGALSEAGRASQLVEICNDLLRRAGVPPLRPAPGAQPAGSATADVDPRTWSLTLPSGRIGDDAVEREEFERLVQVVIGATRRAWQYYLVARWAAARPAPPSSVAPSSGAAAVTTETLLAGLVARGEISAAVADEARYDVGTLPPDGVLALQASAFHEELFGGRRPQVAAMRAQVAQARGASDQLADADLDDPDVAERAGRAARLVKDLWYTRFDLMSHEYDAHFVEADSADEIDAAMKAWYPLRSLSFQAPPDIRIEVDETGRRTFRGGQLVDTRDGPAEYQRLCYEYRARARRP